MNPLNQAQRSTKDGPFCWQNKAALHRIRDVAGESNRPSPASVIAVYVALCELASDAQTESFEASRGQVGGKACVNVRTVDAVLPVLEKCGLLLIERRRIDETTNLPSVYTLLTYGSGIKSLGGSGINSHLAKRSENLTTAPLFKNQEELEESKEVGDDRGAPTRRNKKPTQTDDEWLAELCADAAFAGLDVRHEHAKMIRWCKEKGRKPTRLRLIAWLNRAERPMNGTATGLAGANKNQMPALSDAEHAKGFFHGTEFEAEAKRLGSEHKRIS